MGFPLVTEKPKVLTPFTSGAYSESKEKEHLLSSFCFNPLHFRGIL
ncbi:Uncharacterized protein dnl_41230 [Desulfonema limicola]|uniref:Uncharacterized protein n=1 Tax=Desulfonema limicola TaxID=45656 RepID=A0A975BAQ1_9BACT|nr:Uncharacterized protein dnl_41230 [Desulfonema limicola]